MGTVFPPPLAQLAMFRVVLVCHNSKFREKAWALVIQSREGLFHHFALLRITSFSQN